MLTGKGKKRSGREMGRPFPFGGEHMRVIIYLLNPFNEYLLRTCLVCGSVPGAHGPLSACFPERAGTPYC